MPETLRSCAKTACRWPAAASLSYRYDTRQVWLLDLAITPDPSLYDLCPHHADVLVVPKGWTRVDDRTERPAIVEPAAAERVAAAAGAPSHRYPASVPRTLVSAGNRYESLVRQLPRLAAELADASRATAAAHHAAPATDSSAAAALASEPEPAREPDPAPAEPAQRRFEQPPAGAVPLHGEPPPGALTPSQRTQTPPDDGELSGQLVMPGLGDGPGAVVIDMNRPRRRRTARGSSRSMPAAGDPGPPGSPPGDPVNP